MNFSQRTLPFHRRITTPLVPPAICKSHLNSCDLSIYKTNYTTKNYMGDNDQRAICSSVKSFSGGLSMERANAVKEKDRKSNKGGPEKFSGPPLFDSLTWFSYPRTLGSFWRYDKASSISCACARA